LYLLARQFFSRWAALVAVGLYQTLPYAIYASRAFQPDPLMVMLLVFTLWAFTRWLQSPTWKWTIITGLLAGMTILVKGVAIFMLAPVMAAGLLLCLGWKTALSNPRSYALAALTLLPYGVYMYYGLSISGEMEGQLGMRFFPQYWLEPTFYLLWFNQLKYVFSLPWLVLGLLGLAWLPDKRSRVVIMGVWVGYLLMGFALSHHISTHDYYHEPLIPIVALGVAALADALFKLLPPRRWAVALAAAVLLMGAGMSAWEARTTLHKNDFSQEAAFWQNLGTVLGHDSFVVGLTQDYGYRLEYWGWVRPDNWLTVGDMDVRKDSGQSFTIDSLFAQQTQGKQYFVITMFDELDRQPELKKLLTSQYPVVASGSGYVIYDLQHPLQPVGK
jgi:4-amino-4-deoxy-L-arabinose transferase-like glycosyltransferase